MSLSPESCISYHTNSIVIADSRGGHVMADTLTRDLSMMPFALSTPQNVAVGGRLS